MSSVKDYFNYRFICYGCGIPSITLTGTIEDYENILKNLNELIKLAPNLERIKPIMQKILDTKKGNVDKEFCKNMIKKDISYDEIVASASIVGRKKEDSMSGWILNFINYDNEGKPLNEYELNNDLMIKYIPYRY